MITVRFYKDHDRFYRLETQGHAEFADHGEDIVCAAVSALAQTLVNTLLQTKEADPAYSVDDAGYLDCEVPRNPETLDNMEIQTVFKTIKVGMEGISEAYGDYVRLLEEEVQ